MQAAKGRWWVLVAAAGVGLWGACGPVAAQATGENGLVPVPGRPWTSVIPDPDTFDWSATNRPGYRFRGMTPTVKRFHDYIRAKRERGQALSRADEAYIRGLIMMRRWPEPPRPNPFWAAYMRYMRERTHDDLNTADRIMMGELVFRGLAVFDSSAGPEMERLIKFLTQKRFTPDGWFQNNVMNGPAWMKEFLGATSFDLGPSQPGASTIPKTPDYRSNARLTCEVGGMDIKQTDDVGTTQRYLKGEIRPGNLTVSGNVAIKGVGVNTQVTFVVAGGAERKEQKLTLQDEKGEGATVKFGASIPTTAQMDYASFSVAVETRVNGYVGVQSLRVSGHFTKSAVQKAAEQAAGDAAWRKQVEDTLRNLGYEAGPDGRRVKEMREAVAGGEQAWKDYVDRNLKEQGYSDDAEEFDRLVGAAATGGKVWSAYTGSAGISTLDPSAEDSGSLQLGTGLQDGKLQQPATHFEDVQRVQALCPCADVAPGTVLTAVWMLDGRENARAQLPAREKGPAPFGLYRKEGKLRDGDYRLVISAGERVLACRFFTIGGPGSTEETLEAAREPSPSAMATPAPDTNVLPATGLAAVLTSGASSLRTPLQPHPRQGQISLRLRYTKPGTVLDTVGLNAAGNGDYVLTLTPERKLQWMIYQPQVASPVRQASGWHYLLSSSSLSPDTWHDLVLIYGTSGLVMRVDGQPVARVASPLPLSNRPLYVGDFPGDDHWGPTHNIHPAFTGEIANLSCSP